MSTSLTSSPLCPGHHRPVQPCRPLPCRSRSRRCLGLAALTAQPPAFQRSCMVTRPTIARASPNELSNDNGSDFTASEELSFSTTCADIMTQRIVSCSPDILVEEALDILGRERLTGMPVVDPDTGKLVGIVSDFDLLSLEEVFGKHVPGEEPAGDIFPVAGESWLAFKAVRTLLEKQAGKLVSDVMTPDPVTVSPSTTLEQAARLLFVKNLRRLPVIDENGDMIGVVSRSNIVQAAVKQRKGLL